MNDVLATNESINNISQKRMYIPAFYSLAILFFFFSFCDFKCNNQRIATIKGIELVTGTEIKQDVIAEDLSILKNSSVDIDTTQRVEPSIWAIIAFIAAIVGVTFLFLKGKPQAYATIGVGMIGAVSLLLLQHQIQDKINQKSEFVIISTDFQFGYWAALAVFILIPVLAYLSLKFELKNKG